MAATSRSACSKTGARSRSRGRRREKARQAVANFLGAAKDLTDEYAELAEVTDDEKNQIRMSLASRPDRKTAALMLHEKGFSTHDIAKLTGWSPSAIQRDLRVVKDTASDDAVSASYARTTGKPCQQVALKFADRCAIHCWGAERIDVDRLRLVWLRRKLRCRFSNVRERARLEARVARIERRQLRWVWRTDPTAEGSTLALQPHDLARVDAWLRDVAGIEPDWLTARARDQCLWAGAFPPPLRRRDGAPESEAGVACRGAMAIEDPPGGVMQLARPFSLIPPPRDQQFRTAQKPKRIKAKHAPCEGWLGRCLTDDRGRIFANHANVMIAFRADPGVENAFAYDEMAQTSVLLKPLPVAPNGNVAVAEPPPRTVRDEDVSQAQEWLQHQGLPRIGKDTVHQAVDQRARERAFHPVREWLDNLVWDGTKRLAGWLQTYLGATGDKDYLATVGAMFLIGMVARVYKPGCKADYMLVLEGEQGIEKSRACQVLAGDWFSDCLPDIHDKDAAQHLRGKWLIEIAELAAFTRPESEALKAFITRDHERYRPSYGRKDVIEPRQCVFIGTTNKATYIKDETGGRRFWPVKVTAINIKALISDRERLFAEAVARFRRSEPWWPSAELERKLIRPEQEGRYDADPWEEAIAEYVAHLSRVSVSEIARQALDFDATARVGTADQRRITAVLASLGWRPGRDDKGRFYARTKTP